MMAAPGFEGVNLGGNRLRVETASITLLSILQFIYFNQE